VSQQRLDLGRSKFSSLYLRSCHESSPQQSQECHAAFETHSNTWYWTEGHLKCKDNPTTPSEVPYFVASNISRLPMCCRSLGELGVADSNHIEQSAARSVLQHNLH